MFTTKDHPPFQDIQKLLCRNHQVSTVSKSLNNSIKLVALKKRDHKMKLHL